MAIISNANPRERLEYSSEIAELLHHVLDVRDKQIERGAVEPLKAIVLKPEVRGVRLQRLMSVFSDANVDDVALWSEIVLLGEVYRCFDITLSKKLGTGEAEWLNARLIFKDSAEPMLREWLNRPKVDPLDLEYRHAVGQFESSFEYPDGLYKKRLDLPVGFDSYNTLLSCWASVGDELNSVTSITWRQLASRCFLANSKFLDKAVYKNLLHELYPEASKKIVERPLLIHIFLPENICNVLIIENQDTFLELIEVGLPNTALVYGGGYRVGASRVRDDGLTKFSLQSDCKLAAFPEFQAWWFKTIEQPWQVYFWGDLDYAGMGIAASLIRSFPGLACWQPGYAPMTELLLAKGGHLPEMATKEKQKLVTDSVGCLYADSVLLPAINASGRFVDQEVVDCTQFLEYSG